MLNFLLFVTWDAVEKNVPTNFPDSAPLAQSLPVESKNLSTDRAKY